MSDERPSGRQLALLRLLADERGQTFAYPATRGEASAEIARLTGEPRSHRSEVEEDRSAVCAHARSELDALRIRDDEVEGFGSSAAWRGRSR